MTTPFDFIRPLTAEEYAGLKADLAAHGQLFPILRDQNDVTLDGHHREKALTELGVPTADWKVQSKYFADDDARIAAVLSANHHRRQSTAEDRKRVAEHLYKQGWTQERIAKQLGVSQWTISNDLRGLVVTSKPSRPKGGRPKQTKVAAKQAATTAALAAAVAAGGAAKRPGHKYDVATEKTAAAAVLDAGQSTAETAAQLGVSDQVVIRSVEFERGYRAARADPEIRLEDITSLTQKKRAENFAVQYKRKLDYEFQGRLSAEIQQHMKDIVLPDYSKRIRDANEVMRARLHGVFKPEEYRLILSCLHSDGQRTAERLDKAFKAFKAREKSLLSEKDDPTREVNMPKTWDDLEKLREAKRADDRAKREAAKKAKEAGHSPIDTR